MYVFLVQSEAVVSVGVVEYEGNILVLEPTAGPFKYFIFNSFWIGDKVKSSLAVRDN